MARIYLIAVVALVANQSAAQEKYVVPTGLPPQFVIVGGVDPAKDLLLLQFPVTIPYQIEREVEKNLDGKKIKVKERITTYKTEIKEVPYSLKTYQASEASGRILMGWDQVKSGTMVVLSDRGALDPLYLKLLAPKTLILGPRPPEAGKVKNP